MKIDMNTKEWIQYGTAVAMIVSGIVLAFLSFFMNNYDIADGVLWYIAQALVYAGGIFGVSIYFKERLGEFERRTKKEVGDYILRKTAENNSNETTIDD